MKYLVFNKELDYSRGYMENLGFRDRKLELIDCDASKAGRFFSRTLDSGEAETVWHRLVMEAWIGENMAIYVYLYATDSKSQAEKVERFWKQGAWTLPEMLSQMKDFLKLEVRNPEDILLHEVQGRYLWLGMLIWGNGMKSPSIQTIQIYFPKEVWNRYLPEIYQGKKQGFLERFLSIFQSLYEDFEVRIRKDTSWLDLCAVEPEMLNWLAGWIHVENGHLWKPEHLRQYLMEGAALFGQRGTARGLVRMVEIFTGETPFLVERGKGEEAHWFTLFLSEKVIADSRSYRSVEQIIREGKPADMEVNLALLRPYLFLDRDTYLGINSQLNEYGAAALDPESAFDFVLLGGAQDEEPDLHSI